MLKVLTKREKTILYTTMGVILFAVVFNLLLYPFFKKNSDLSKEINVSRQKLKNYALLLSQKDAILSKYSALASAAKATAAQDPLVTGLAELENMAGESDIRIIDIRPESQVKTQGPYKEALIELRAEGQEENFLKFIYKIENSMSLLKIKKFQLSSRQNTQALEGRFSISLLFASE